MHGTWVMPHQNGQGMNGQNPDAQRGYGFLERKPGTGAEKPLELAGQELKVKAQQAIQTLKNEINSFNGQELEKLGIITREATKEIYSSKLNEDPKLNEDLARIVELMARPFGEAVKRLFMKTSAEIQEVLSNNSGSNPGSTQDSNEPPLSFLGPNTPSKQNPQGPVSAA